MRKQQTKILEKARKSETFSHDQIDVLSREDAPIALLEVVFKYFQTQNQHELDQALTSADANKWIDFLLEKRSEGKLVNTDEMLRLANRILPNPFDKDTLVGDKKKMKIYTSYRIAREYDRKYQGTDAEKIHWDLRSLYVDLLYQGLEYKEMRPLLKKLICETTTYACWKVSRLLDIYSCLADDYAHNKENSFLMWLIENKKDGNFDPTPESMEKLYDYENRKFVFQLTDFDKYFSETFDWCEAVRWVENQEAIAELEKDQHPFVEYIANWCKSNDMLSSRDQNKSYVFDYWCLLKLFDEELERNFQDCFRMLQRRFTVDAHAWRLAVSTSPSFFVNITYSEYNKVDVYSQDGYWGTEKPIYSTTIVVTPDCKIFKRIGTKNEKLIPLPFKDLLRLLDKRNKVGELISTMLNFYAKNNPFVKDVVNDCQECGCVMPLNFNDVLEHYNRAHYLQSKYKLAKELKVNWNKQNLNLSYCIIKAYPWLEPGVNQQILLQQKDMKLLPRVDRWSRGREIEEKITEFVSNVIYENLLASEIREKKKEAEAIKHKCEQEFLTEVQTALLDGELDSWVNDRLSELGSANNGARRTIRDYVEMTRRAKRKIRIDVRSVRQIENLHDAAANGEGWHKKHTSAVNIPKNSKFNKLREILPEEFEWIKTKKRLVMETELQHHCVWSYADKITKDNCAIYSFVDSAGEYSHDGQPKRYTIEFMVNKKGEYFIEQVQGKYDRVNTMKMQEYIQKILDDAQKKGKSD